MAAVAIHLYLNYTKKAKFIELVQATATLKQSVEECLQSKGLATGSNGLPVLPATTGMIRSFNQSIGVDNANDTITWQQILQVLA